MLRGRVQYHHPLTGLIFYLSVHPSLHARMNPSFSALIGQNVLGTSCVPDTTCGWYRAQRNVEHPLGLQSQIQTRGHKRIKGDDGKAEWQGGGSKKLGHRWLSVKALGSILNTARKGKKEAAQMYFCTLVFCFVFMILGLNLGPHAYLHAWCYGWCLDSPKASCIDRWDFWDVTGSWVCGTDGFLAGLDVGK